MTDQFKSLLTQVRKHVPVPEETIQDAQIAAGNRMYVKAIDDCIEVAKTAMAGWLVVKFEELKAAYLENVS